MFHGTGRMGRRLTSLLLAAVLLLGMAPGLILPASAHWADQYLDQLVDWGVMRADQTSDPDAPVTRAEFMAIINRAYGYTQTGPIPFTDVSRNDWFYDDVAIAYNAGYMAGTSATKASPNLKLNREMAVCILARNMMMKETPGENLAFADARQISGWARGLVKTAVDNYIVSGYPNNKFGPQDLVSKGQMASLVTRCIGTPLNKPGEYALGDVFDNVTITSSGVTLRNTTVSGDLYVSGGVGLGNVRLENVNVLGRIIVSGTGESERGDASVVLRNVTANEMLVDNMKKQLVTLRAEGLTNIAQTVVRTNAYLEDNTPDDRGLQKITLENSGAKLDLAGRIKDVVNTAPQSTVKVAKGTVARLTVDEAAVNSTVQLDRNTEVKELNLDTATNVTGQGDVDKMNVNASGVTSTMLPDEIYIRPGLEANISGENMDTAAAEESSRDPRILSGYPIANDVAPTSLRADFAANKRGTIYWAVSNITDGSVTAEDLISPPSYGSRALKNGSVATPSADTVVPVRITGLTVGGSYYLSAVLVDNRGERSPVKVIAFTTPDNTKPAFAQGYPYMSLVTDTLGQATVMATKSCKLYYAVLPQGAQAPTVNDLRSASVTGNLGYGVMDVVKNTEHTFTVSSRLEELKNYVAYFWLTDADGANSSNIVSLKFTTKDSTPPVFDPEPYLNSDPKDTSVSLTAGLNEAGTIYWVVVPRGETYPKRNPNNPADNEEFNNEERAKLDTEYAKQQVKNGRNATKRGTASVRNAETDVTINITGLAKETAYDFYYVAQDTAGNFSDRVKMIPINTADNSAPTISQSFSPNGGDASREPLVTSKISITFSEDVCSSAGAGAGKSLLTLRNELADAKTAEEARKNLVEFLTRSVELWKTDPSAPPAQIKPKGESTGDWIDFNNATIVSTTKGGSVTVELPYNADETKSAHHLSSGATYYFLFRDIEDSSDSHNSIQDGNGKDTTELYWQNMGKTHNIPTFTTVFARVLLSSPTLDSSRPLRDKDSPDTNHKEDTAVTKDFSFRMIPDATERVDAKNSYDLVLFSDTDLAFDLYCRISYVDDDNNTVYLKKQGTGTTTEDTARYAGILAKGDADGNNWFYLGNSKPIVHPADGGAENWRGVSVMGNTGMGNSGQNPYPQVRDLKEKYTYDFIITVTEIDGRKDRKVWTDRVNFEVHVLAGDSGRLGNLANNSTKDEMKKATDLPLTSGGLASIGTDMQAGRKYLALDWQFSDTRVPEFWEGYPNITSGADWADVKVQLDRAGQYYYVVAPYNGIGTVVENQTWTGLTLWEQLPKKGQNKAKGDGTFERVYQSKDGDDIKITAPNAQAIMSSNTYQKFKPERLPITYPAGSPEVTIELRKLEPRSKYIIYFVLKGTMDEPSPVFAYAFETTDTGRPHITIRPTQSGTATLETQYPSSLYYRMFTTSDARNIKELMADFSAKDKLPAPYNDTTTGIKTVLDALTTVYDHSRLTNSSDTNAKTAADTGASIFDLYASNDEKNAIARLIKENQYTLNTGGSATSVNDGPKTTSGTRNPYSTTLTRDDLNKMEFEPTTYVLLVMGHHASSDESREPYEIDAFRAEQNFRRTDTEAPNLTGFSVSPFNYNGTQKTFSGTMTLKFDKALYWIAPNASSTDRVRVDQDDGTYTKTSGSTEGTVGITYGHTANGTLKARTGGVTDGPRDEFIINFSSIKLDTNGSITFQLLPNGKFSNVNGQNIDARLEILVSENPKGSDGKRMYVNARTGLEVEYIMVAYWNGQMVSNDFRLNN